MLTGLSRPDSGQIIIEGIDVTKKPRSAQHLLGVVPDESNLYPELTGYENLVFCASLYGVSKTQREKRALELLEMFDLTGAKDRKVGGYSKGMKRKLTIAAGIIHNPSILFLDEPTTGIDVASARQLRTIVSDLHDDGTTILLTTHYIEEAERLCDRIAFIVSGKIVKTDSVSNLIEPVKEQQILELTCSSKLDKAKSDIISPLGFKNVSFSGNGILTIQDNKEITVAPVVKILDSKGIDVYEAKRIKPSLEDVFVDVTGIKISEIKNGKVKMGGKGQ